MTLEKTEFLCVNKNYLNKKIQKVCIDCFSEKSISTVFSKYLFSIQILLLYEGAKVFSSVVWSQLIFNYYYMQIKMVHSKFYCYYNFIATDKKIN